jgi:hypothetical protein
MSTAGDYRFFKTFYKNKTTDVNILVGTQNYADVVTPRSTAYQVFVQKITLSITTHAANTLTVDDDGSGPAIAAHTDATAAAGVPSTVTWDFGPEGRPITGNLDINQSAAGIVGVVHIEAYEKLVTPVAVGANN